MKVVILAGGKGERLRPLTEKIPKPMVKVGQYPMIEHIIRKLKAFSLTDIIITLGYKGEVIKRYFKDGDRFGVNIKYSDEPFPLGTAGAVKNCESMIGGDFLVVSGDAFFDFDFDAFTEFHFDKGGLCTIAVKEVENVSRFGVVVTNDEGRIINFIEKPERSKIKTVNMGVYAMKREVLDLIPDGFFDFGKDLFPTLCGKMFAYKSDGYWSDVGTLTSLYMANKFADSGVWF